MGFWIQDAAARSPVPDAGDRTARGPDCHSQNAQPPISNARSGLRFYSPGLGRWLIRDPIGAASAAPLHVFAGNHPLDSIDWLGFIEVRILNGDTEEALGKESDLTKMVVERAPGPGERGYEAKMDAHTIELVTGLEGRMDGAKVTTTHVVCGIKIRVKIFENPANKQERMKLTDIRGKRVGVVHHMSRVDKAQYPWMGVYGSGNAPLWEGIPSPWGAVLAHEYGHVDGLIENISVLTDGIKALYPNPTYPPEGVDLNKLHQRVTHIVGKILEKTARLADSGMDNWFKGNGFKDISEKDKHDMTLYDRLWEKE